MPLDKHPTPIKSRSRKSRKIRDIDSESLAKRLDAYPNLRGKILEVLDAADNEGGIKEADAAEDLIVGIIKDLGGLTLQTWADN